MSRNSNPVIDNSKFQATAFLLFNSYDRVPNVDHNIDLTILGSKLERIGENIHQYFFKLVMIKPTIQGAKHRMFSKVDTLFLGKVFKSRCNICYELNQFPLLNSKC